MSTNGRRLRVLHLTSGLDVGGQEKLLVEFARHADRAGFVLRFVCLGGRGRLAPDVEAEGWPVAALGEGEGLRAALVLRLASLLRAWRPDVLHTHDVRPLVYGPPAARLARVPAVVHTKHYGPGVNLTRRQRGLGALAARLVDRYICVSEDSARTAVAEGVAARKVLTVRNGIDVRRFAYQGPAAEGPVVTVARLSAEKDISTLLRAVSVAARQEPGLRLEVAGDGPCREELLQTTAALGLTGRVAFLGEVHDVPALLARARLFALSSLTEGISLTLLEAMARGLPVVATRVGGNPEVVGDGVTGLLVPPRDPEALAGALLRVWRDDAAGHVMGLAGRRRVEQEFDVRRMVARYEAIYRELTDRTGRRRGQHAGVPARW